jgi:hypothetical protein
LEKARDKALQEWNDRDVTKDGDADGVNSGLETAKNNAEAAFTDTDVQQAIDDKLAAWEEENNKIQGLRDTLATNEESKEGDRKDAELNKAYDYLYGKEAEGD